MKRLLLSTAVALSIGAGALFTAPRIAHADQDWDLRHSNYRQRWNDHRQWRGSYYQPYYQNYYRSQPSYSRYHSSYPQTYYYRPNYGGSAYGGAYYGSPYGGYRDYRGGGSVRVGPLRFNWR